MTETPTREEVARAIVRAETPEELEEARTVREAYLQRNPQDDDIRAMDDLLDTLAEVLAPKDAHGEETNIQR